MDFASYVSGFVDGEGCFSISFTLRAKLKTGIEVRPSFSISQNKRNYVVLEEIRDFFDCGSIRFSKRDQNYKYEVRSVADLVKKIIPHFKKYPLRTTKQKDFEIFTYVCNLVNQSKHLNKKFLNEIIENSYKMNESGKRKYSKVELLRVLGKMKR